MTEPNSWTSLAPIQPTVDASREFLEIAADFANPLDLVREAISNAYDAQATEIAIKFEVFQRYGESQLRIVIEDNGEGMGLDGLQAFFGLGTSPRAAAKAGCPECGFIGEKGHGTKIYLNSELVQVLTHRDGRSLRAVMERPYARLHENELPLADVTSRDSKPAERGTQIEILGYNRNRRDQFNHEQLKDHVLWLTKHGSVEKVLGRTMRPEATLFLKGIDRDQPERIPAGHPFPGISASMENLFEQYMAEAPKHFCRRWVRKGNLPDYPEIAFDAVFSLEGDKLKRQYNPMLRRQGATPRPGSYQVQDRYGLWLCKDHIPVQRKNDWITTKGSEYTRLHAFVNCQALKLTANRGSVENTPSEVLAALEKEVRKIYDEILETDDWSSLDWLEEQALGHQTQEKERKDYERRKDKIRKLKRAQHKGVSLIEPRMEQGVYALAVALSAIAPDLFPFEIVDYDTANGIDVLAKTRDAIATDKTHLRYLEFKHTLQYSFNHSFKYLYGIVCWRTTLRHEEEISDIAGAKRRMVITPASKEVNYTRYLLDAPDALQKIEVFVLEEYLRDRLGLEFR